MTCSPTVTRLPTAPRRRVQQKCNKASRAAKAALRAGQTRHFPYIQPHVREALPDAELILGCSQTPELAMALALWHSLPDDLRAQAEGNLRLMARKGGPAMQALALVKRRTIAERIDLDAAFDLLARER